MPVGLCIASSSDGSGKKFYSNEWETDAYLEFCTHHAYNMWLGLEE